MMDVRLDKNFDSIDLMLGFWVGKIISLRLEVKKGWSHGVEGRNSLMRSMSRKIFLWDKGVFVKVKT